MFRFKKPSAATYSAPATTGAPLVITWSSNEPTAAATQTIANGTIPTVAELGQFAQNINTIVTAVLVDNAAMKAKLAALGVDVAGLKTVLNEGN